MSVHQEGNSPTSGVPNRSRQTWLNVRGKGGVTGRIMETKYGLDVLD